MNTERTPLAALEAVAGSILAQEAIHPDDLEDDAIATALIVNDLPDALTNIDAVWNAYNTLWRQHHRLCLHPRLVAGPYAPTYCPDCRQFL